MPKINYTVLSAELAAPHPVTGAYSTDPATALAEFTSENISVIVDTVPSSALFEAIMSEADDLSGWNNLLDSQRQVVRDILVIYAIEGVPTANNTPAREKLEAIFPPGSATRTAIVSLISKNVSRYDQLKPELGYSGRLTISHITEALGV